MITVPEKPNAQLLYHVLEAHDTGFGDHVLEAHDTGFGDHVLEAHDRGSELSHSLSSATPREAGYKRDSNEA